MRIDYEIDVSCRPEELFPWVAEPEKAMMWMKGVKSAEVLKETPGKVGTEFKEVMEEGGESLEMHGTITGYVGNKLIAFHLESRVHEVDVSYTIESCNDTARLLTMSTIGWKFRMNIMSLIFGRKLKGKIIGQLESEFSELKRLCEK